MAIQGRIQREREVVHLRWQLNDPTGDLAALADRDTEFWDRNERGDEFAHGSPDGGDGRDRPPPNKVRDMFVPDLQIDTL